MSSDYDMNEHIHGMKYQYQYPIDGQVSSRGSIRHKAEFDQCRIHLRVRHIITPSRSCAIIRQLFYVPGSN